MSDLSDLLRAGWPEAQYNWPSTRDYDTLEWFGPGDKPTLQEINAYVLPVLKKAKCAQVNVKRDALLAQGLTVDVNGDQSLMIPVDLRNETDLHRINGVATNALEAELVCARSNMAAIRACVVDAVGVINLGTLLGADVDEPAEIPNQVTVDFIGADNTVYELNCIQAKALGVACARRVSSLQVYARNLKNTILAAEDGAALDQIDIESGWPE